MGNFACLGKKFSSLAFASIFSLSAFEIRGEMPSNSSPSCSQYQRTASICVISFSLTISSIFIQNVFGEFNNIFHPIKVWEANRGLPRMYYGITRNPGRWFESIGKTFSTYLSEGSFLSCIVCGDVSVAKYIPETPNTYCLRSESHGFKVIVSVYFSDL